MPALTAVLHTHNDALRLGRALETLYPCDEILIIDHGSDDQTPRVARQYGAKLVQAYNDPGSDFLRDLASEWILCLDPRESLTESLAAALFDWKAAQVSPGAAAFSVFHREETVKGWVQHAHPQTRIVPAHWSNWDGYLPLADSSAVSLEGELLRFAFP